MLSQLPPPHLYTKMSSVDKHSLDKPFPGCLGRMVNLFDLSAGMTGNRLLSDKPHRDYSPRRSQSDTTMLGQFGDQIEDDLSLQITSKYARNNISTRKSNGTPMKMLIAREMSKELRSKPNPPSVVAKLMGLDTLPQQDPQLASQRSHSRDYYRTNSDSHVNYLQQDEVFWDAQKQHELHNYTDPNEYKDVYEIMQQSQKLNRVKDKSPYDATCDAASYDKKEALVREKFIEAKRLSTDEKSRQSPGFDDALEVLNSNKDLFLKLLQEPNSIFSQRLQNLQSVNSQHETKRITLLKPCKMIDNERFAGLAKKNEKQVKKSALVNRVDRDERKHSGPPSPAVDWKLDDNSCQPTRIVVLKPSPGKAQDIKAVVSSMAMSSRVLHDEVVEETDDFEAQQSGEVATEITPHTCANLRSHHRDDFLLSSMFSNGYVGDESSFRKSETEFAAGNLSDSEVMSPAFRHSWDYVNRFSPHSVSSFSLASHSPDSSVCKEAKKRLSERWATMTSSGNNHQEQRHIRRSSSTLGEMLALSDTKNATPLVEEGYKEDPKDLTLNKDEGFDKSSRNLARSKSVPVSSTVFGTGINVDAPNQEASKNVKKSLKGKVSSLFFSRNKNAGKGKSSVSQSKDESQTHETCVTSPGKASNDTTHCDDDSFEDYAAHIGNRSSDKAPSLELSGEACTVATEVGWNLNKHLTYGNASENQDQPSPISVLETTFEYEPTAAIVSSGQNNHENGRLILHSKYNLIDKSPPIGSIARTLSWDDSCLDTANPYPLQTSFTPQRAEEEEREWFSFVQTLLSVAGLDGEMQSDMFLARLYSSDSALDPSLLNKYVDLNGKETVHEAKRRHKRSIRRLVFDCVNAALLDIAEYKSDSFDGSSIVMLDQVWGRMKEWFSGEERCVAVDCWDSNNQVVDRVVKKEVVVGKGWAELLRFEMDNVELEIERRLMEELLGETVIEVLGRA